MLSCDFLVFELCSIHIFSDNNSKLKVSGNQLLKIYYNLLVQVHRIIRSHIQIQCSLDYLLWYFVWIIIFLNLDKILHSHLHILSLNFPPLMHTCCWSQLYLVVVVRIVVGIIESHRKPVYFVGQMHLHNEAINWPPFKHESYPHLQIGIWHIKGQIFAIDGFVHSETPKSFKQLSGWLLQFSSSHWSPLIDFCCINIALMSLSSFLFVRGYN